MDVSWYDSLVCFWDWRLLLAIGVMIALCLSTSDSIEYELPHMSLISHGTVLIRIQKLDVHGRVWKKSSLSSWRVLIAATGPYDAHASGGVPHAMTLLSSLRKAASAILDTDETPCSGVHWSQSQSDASVGGVHVVLALSHDIPHAVSELPSPVTLGIGTHSARALYESFVMLSLHL